MKTKYESSFWLSRTLILLAMLVVMAAFYPTFFMQYNISPLLSSFSVFGVAACGALLSAYAGGVDFSIGSVGALSAIIFAKITEGQSPSVGIIVFGLILTYAAAALVGVIHGVAIGVFKAPSYAVTLMTKYIILGICYLLMKDTNTIYLSSEGNMSFLRGLGRTTVGPVPVMIFVLAAALVFETILISKTRFGRKMNAAAGNEEFAAVSGLHVFRIKTAMYVLSAVFTATAGILMLSTNMSASVVMMQSYELYILGALIVGGIRFRAGKGKLSGAVLGAAFMALAVNILTQIGFEYETRRAILGVVVLVAAAGPVLISRFSARTRNNIDTEF